MESAAPLRILRTGATTARAALPGSLEPDKTGAVTTAVAALAETPAADETAPGGVGPGRFPPWSSDFQILGPLPTRSASSKKSTPLMRGCAVIDGDSPL